MYKKRNKSAQATIFIIIGLVALILVFGVVYFTGIVTKEDIIGEKQADPVTAYTQECLQKITEQGIVVLGQQGGHIYLDQYPLDMNEFAPLESPVLKVSEYQAIPYWYYQRVGGADRSEMPKLEKTSANDGSVQDQLERYITENMPTCINDFDIFKQQGTVVEALGEMSVSVIFTEEDVVVTLNYPLNLIKDQNLVKLEHFSTKVNARVKKAYTFAREIASYEETTTFLEQNTMNLITMYGRVNPDYLPPLFGGLQVVDCNDMTYWMEDKVHSSFKNVLAMNLPYLKIRNSDFERIIVSQGEQKDEEKRSTMQGIFDMMTKEVSKSSYPDFLTMFEYRPNFPLELDLGQKGMIKPPTQMDFNYLFGRKCVFIYKFPYSFKYPVLVTLVDKDSRINQQPFIFQFPLLVVTKANFPRADIKDVLGLETMPRETYLCGEDQKTSKESVVNVIDKQTSAPLSDAMVYYQCGPSVVDEYDENGTLVNSTPFSDRCFIGKTDQSGAMVSKFPPCLGGATVVVEKKGYGEDAVIIGDVQPNKEFTTMIELAKLTKLSMNIQKYFTIAPIPKEDLEAAQKAGLKPKQGVILKDGQVVGCNLYTSASVLDKNEQAIINLKRIDPTIASTNPYTFAFYTEENKPEIELAPGVYQVDIMLIRGEKWKGELDIKKNSESYHIDGALFEKDKDVYYPDDDQQVDSIISGGANYIMTIEPDDIDGKKEMTLYVFDEGKPQKIENYFIALSHRDACSSINYDKIQPIFSK
ncbi:MAG: hypothetical protein ABIG89_07310 [Candidatus Woesearchaeota archaeon]